MMALLHVALAAMLAHLAGWPDGAGLLGALALLHLVLRWLPLPWRWQRYQRRLEIGLGFSLWFIAEIVRASLDVARIVAARQLAVAPAVLALPLRRPGPRMATAFGLLLTLTPGTLALDYDMSRGVLYVHVLDATQRERVEAGLRAIETRLLAWLDAGPTAEGKA